jgi:type IV pilus assembly protein PilV
MVEAMTALAVLSIGATGIVGIQRATLAGNTNARNLATANQIATTWIERLRADALQWNAANGVDDLADTNWLKKAPANPGGWLVPATVNGIGSPAADIVGSDIFKGEAITQAFCTHLRLTTVYPTLIRAEVRVFWSRHGNPVKCDEAPSDTDAMFGNKYGFVVVTTAINQNTAVGP